MATRSYVTAVPGGTATTTVQMQGKSSIRQILVSLVNAAAGTLEVSKSASSQIGSNQPADVLCRVRSGATASHTNVVIPLNEPVQAFENIYIHQTGTGNVGDVTLIAGT